MAPHRHQDSVDANGQRVTTSTPDNATAPAPSARLRCARVQNLQQFEGTHARCGAKMGVARKRTTRPPIRLGSETPRDSRESRRWADRRNGRMSAPETMTRSPFQRIPRSPAPKSHCGRDRENRVGHDRESIESVRPRKSVGLGEHAVLRAGLSGALLKPGGVQVHPVAGNTTSTKRSSTFRRTDQRVRRSVGVVLGRVTAARLQEAVSAASSSR